MSGAQPVDEPLFDRRAAAQPHLRAVEQLAADMGRTLDEMERHTESELFGMAERHYGDGLPEFWRIWKDWHGDDDVAAMGDL